MPAPVRTTMLVAVHQWGLNTLSEWLAGKPSEYWTIGPRRGVVYLGQRR